MGALQQLSSQLRPIPGVLTERTNFKLSLEYARTLVPANSHVSFFPRSGLLTWSRILPGDFYVVTFWF